jgi:hypothetical protein
MEIHHSARVFLWLSYHCLHKKNQSPRASKCSLLVSVVQSDTSAVIRQTKKAQFSLIKCDLLGTFHAVSKAHLHRYCVSDW